MQTRSLSRWLLPIALSGVVAIAAVDAVMLSKHHAPPPVTQAVPQKIGLAAEADGDALQLQWNRRARQVRDADHAILYIRDGSAQSQLDLTPQQLQSASLRYWPESKAVAFRMEIYSGNISSSDSVQVPVAEPAKLPPARKATRALLVKNPSPFERVRPEMTRHQAALLEPVVARPEVVEPPTQIELRPESGFSRMVSKIPLLRRLKAHRQADPSSSSADIDPRR